MTRHSADRRRTLARAASIAGLSLAVQAQAQVVERNLPPAPTTPAAPLLAPNAVPTAQDATPIGPDLRAIALLAAAEPARSEVADGIDLKGAARLSADADRSRKALAPFLGQPISRQLIARIEAAIARRYRALGYPFVSVSTPEQAISGGAIQIRVIEFVAGSTTTHGARSDASYIASQVSIRPGAAIDAPRLGDDLAWLNRYPFRQVAAVFTPGPTLGTSDLLLNVVETKPWQVYAGYADSGSQSTGVDRTFAGFSVGGLLGRDSVLSYQATLSDDEFEGSAHPHYQSHAVTLTVPVGHDAAIEASGDYVVANQASGAFTVGQTTWEGALGYRFALSNLGLAGGSGDGRFGIEAKRQDATTYFANSIVNSEAIDIYQLYLGYALNHDGALGHSTLDAAIHFSPGGVDAANGAARMAQYSQGRLDRALYAYLTLNLDNRLPIFDGFAWRLQVGGQGATGPLPRTEQAGLGGASLVRGYTLDAGGFDSTLVIRDSLYAPEISHGGIGGLTPYVFGDVGVGWDQFTGASTTIASCGVGLDLHLAAHATLSVDAAFPLASANGTKAGDPKAEAQVVFRF